MADRTLPDGFTLKAVETTAEGFKYTVEVPQAESLDAVMAFYEAQGKNPEEVLLAIWNAGNEQGSKQGGKGEVRAAIKEHGPDSPEGEKAIAGHQENAQGYIQGAPRGGGGARHESGLTRKQRDALGTAVADHLAKEGTMPTQADMREIAKALEIPEDLV